VKVSSSAGAGGGGGNEALPLDRSGILLLACEMQMESKSRFLSRGTFATKASANV